MDVIPVFVGDQPSSKNTDPTVPFVGTKSFFVLANWISELKIDRYFMLNSHTEDQLDEAMSRFMLGSPIIALGNKASDRLSKRGIPHFKLPHPSGRNRKLNDPSFIVGRLESCKNFLKEIHV